MDNIRLAEEKRLIEEAMILAICEEKQLEMETIRLAEKRQLIEETKKLAIDEEKQMKLQAIRLAEKRRLMEESKSLAIDEEKQLNLHTVRLEEKRRLIEEAKRLAIDDEKRLVNRLLLDAKLAYQTGDFLTACEMISEIIKFADFFNDATLLSYQAACHWKLGQYKEAVNAASHSLKFGANDMYATRNYSYIINSLIAQGLICLCEKALERLQILDPQAQAFIERSNNIIVKLNETFELIDLMYANDNLYKVIEYCNLALDLAPACSKVQRKKAECLVILGNYVEGGNIINGVLSRTNYEDNYSTLIMESANYFMGDKTNASNILNLKVAIGSVYESINIESMQKQKLFMIVNNCMNSIEIDLAIFELTRETTTEELKRACRRLSLRYHPDKSL